MMEVYVEVIGQIKDEVIENRSGDGTPYIIIRVYTKPQRNADTMYFQAFCYAGESCYQAIKNFNLQQDDEVIIRGKLQQKYVYEEGYKIVDGHREPNNRLVCKNRVYLHGINILQRASYKQQSNYKPNLKFEGNTSVTSGGREKIGIAQDDNPFD